MSLRQLIDATSITSETDDSVTKVINSADALMALPSPSNVRRRKQNIVGVPITLILSTTQRTPQRIVDLIATSESQELLADPDKYLYGLCISGRRYPLELYLHQFLYDKQGAANNTLFEDAFLHEFIHGYEGIYKTRKGAIRRTIPWSFLFQKRLNELDASGNSSISRRDREGGSSTYIDYLHHGLDLQDNVSELFARMGVLMLRHIRESGEVPLSTQETHAVLHFYGLIEDFSYLPDESVTEATDIWKAIKAYKPEARKYYWQNAPKMFSRAAGLYGCDSPK